MDPYITTKVRRAYVDVLGIIWMPAVMAAKRTQLSDRDLKNIGEFTRENVYNWLAVHEGDFRSIEDFYAVVGEEEIDWVKDTSEAHWLDCTSPHDE